MKDIFVVTKFTMKDMIKRKSFIISTLIILALIVIGFNIPNIIKSFQGDNISFGDKLLIVDNENIFEGNLELLKQMDLGYDIEIGPATFEEIKTKIENDEIYDAIIIEKQANNVKIKYIVESTTMMEGVPEQVVSMINTLYTNMQISKLGLTEAELQSITPNFEFSLEQTDEEEAKYDAKDVQKIYQSVIKKIIKDYKDKKIVFDRETSYKQMRKVALDVYLGKHPTFVKELQVFRSLLLMPNRNGSIRQFYHREFLVYFIVDAMIDVALNHPDEIIWWFSQTFYDDITNMLKPVLVRMKQKDSEKIFENLLHYKSRIPVALLFMTAATICDLMLPTIMSNIVDKGIYLCQNREKN